MSRPHRKNRQSLRIAGCFAGIGGIELGLKRHGHDSVILSEIEPTAQAVLKARFPEVPLAGDIRAIKRLPECDLISAGFPCQDLSQCGRTAGVDGADSSLVNEVFRLIESAVNRPNWVLLENVPFMLALESGRAIRVITKHLTRLGYRWAYRTVNARAFGVPQRRLRVVIIAARDADPREVIFADDEPVPKESPSPTGFGFYWTEGTTGLGWAANCVPTLKSGSTIGIPSPPAIWMPSQRRLATIDIRDAERLQGFPVNWTSPAMTESARAGVRWRLVGNAVCVRVAVWVGKRLAAPGKIVCEQGPKLKTNDKWPAAAYGDESGSYEVLATAWPIAMKQTPIVDFLRFPTRPLSARATGGFLSRAKKSRLRFQDGFLSDVAHHLDAVEAVAKCRK